MKTQRRRPARVAEMLRMEISEILARGLRDPRIGLTTVTEVKMSPDLKSARVYISVLGGSEEQQQTLEGLNRAASHIRHELGTRLRLKTAPELSFLYDSSIEYGAKIEELIQRTKKPIEPADE